MFVQLCVQEYVHACAKVDERVHVHLHVSAPCPCLYVCMYIVWKRMTYKG